MLFFKMGLPLILMTLVFMAGSQETDPECTIYIRDHDMFDDMDVWEEDGLPRRVPSARNSSAGDNLSTRSSRVTTGGRADGAKALENDQRSRLAVATSMEAISVLWQEGPYLFIRRFSHSCRTRSPAVVVTRDTGLTKSGSAPDLGTGVGDAVALTDGRVAVVWLVNGEIWAKVVQFGDASASPVRVNAEGRHPRREVTMTATPDGNGFVVAWSSFGQDGDGWGIAARMFTVDGKPIGLEQQINVDGVGSQQSPQLFACTTGKKGPAVWASWHNGTVGNTREFYVRRLGAKSWDLGPVLTLDGSGFVSAASLMCASGSSTQNPTVIWAGSERGRETSVSWSTLVENTGRQLLAKASSVSLGPDDRQKQFLHNANRSKLQKGAVVLASVNGSSFGGRSKQSKESARMETMQMRAEGDVLAVAMQDDRGSVSVRIYDMAPTASYPLHQLTFGGSKIERVVYDVTMDQALIVCFSHKSGVTCDRRHLQSLMEAEMEQVSWWFGVVVFFLLFWLRHECMGGEARESRSRSRQSASMLRRLHFENSLADDLPGLMPRSAWRTRGKYRM